MSKKNKKNERQLVIEVVVTTTRTDDFFLEEYLQLVIDEGLVARREEHAEHIILDTSISGSGPYE